MVMKNVGTEAVSCTVTVFGVAEPHAEYCPSHPTWTRWRRCWCPLPSIWLLPCESIPNLRACLGARATSELAVEQRAGAGGGGGVGGVLHLGAHPLDVTEIDHQAGDGDDARP